jgi:hypothetical protein
MRRRAQSNEATSDGSGTCIGVTAFDDTTSTKQRETAVAHSFDETMITKTIEGDSALAVTID